MSTSIKLQIAEPCHENWNSMTDKEQGRFCGSCQKTVVDFSIMTDQEILNHLSKASQQVCGRFYNDQLHKELKVATTKKRFSFAYLWNLLLATLLFTETNAQVKPVKPKAPVITQPTDQRTMGLIAYVPEEKHQPMEIHGQVTDAFSNRPIEAVTIHIQGTSQTAGTDAAGNFMVSVKNKDSVVLEISAVGYTAQTVIISRYNCREDVKIFLKPAERILMGSVSVEHKPVKKKNIKKRM